MKKLVLSVVLGMFCYCTNNAMEEEEVVVDNEEQKEENKKEAPPVEVKNINYVLNSMIHCQMTILEAKLKIMLAQQSEKIYSTIKDQEEGKVTKKNLLNFIQNQISTKDKTNEELKDDIKILEQYFHLKERGEDDECNEGNLTEIFWENGEEGDVEEEKIEDVVDEIKNYFTIIIAIEKKISANFKEYYEAKKAKKEGVENVEDVVIEEIMQECCGKETEGEKPTKFFANLENLCPKTLFKETKETILATIKRRITLTEPIKEEDIKSFLKQKIGLQNKKCTKPKEEEKKEEEKINPQAEDVKNQEEGCPCCNC